MVLVCPWCSVLSMSAARRWRWAPLARLQSCCPLSWWCHVRPPYSLIGHPPLVLKRWGCWPQDRVALVGRRQSLVVALLCAWVLLWAGVGRNLCRLVRPLRGAAFEWHHFFLEGVVASLRLLHSRPRETLGPSGQSSRAMSTVLSFLKVLLGSGRFRVLGAWWEKSEGA
jgi:hypothetical protein